MRTCRCGHSAISHADEAGACTVQGCHCNCVALPAPKNPPPSPAQLKAAAKPAGASVAMAVTTAIAMQAPRASAPVQVAAAPTVVPGAPDPLAGVDDYLAGVRRRLEAGRREYGDRSFSLAPAALFAQVEEELMDVAGWAYVLVVRLRAAARALEASPKAGGACYVHDSSPEAGCQDCATAGRAATDRAQQVELAELLARHGYGRGPGDPALAVPQRPLEWLDAQLRDLAIMRIERLGKPGGR